MKYLYRGQSQAGHIKNNGLIASKGVSFVRNMRIGEPMATFGVGFTIGASERNAVISHQYDSNLYPTSGISTTPIYERALYYATSGGSTDGVIYVISRKLMEKYYIKEFDVNSIVNKPKVPIDHEIILVPSGKSLPLEIIVDVISVNAK